MIMLNGDLDWKAAQHAYSEKGWVKIEEVLDPGFSAQVGERLLAQPGWEFFYTGDAQEPVTVSSEQIFGLTQE